MRLVPGFVTEGVRTFKDDHVKCAVSAGNLSAL